jgi:hypothetical protein
MKKGGGGSDSTTSVANKFAAVFGLFFYNQLEVHVRGPANKKSHFI